MRASTKGRLAAASIVIAASLAYAIWYGLKFVESTVGPRYAIEWTSVFILEHLDENNHQWPRDWEDLRDEFESRGSGYAWSFQELQTLVVVRWDIQLPEDRQRFTDDSFRVIELPDSNSFRRVLEIDLEKSNRSVRNYVVDGQRPESHADRARP